MHSEMKNPNLNYQLTIYFDSLINSIDIYTEIQLKSLIENPLHESEFEIKQILAERQTYLNELRNDFIDEIRRVKQENLGNDAHVNEASMFKVFSFLLQKSNEINSSKLYLVKTNDFFEKTEIEYLKYWIF